MGVPGFFLWLWKNYKKSSFVFTKSKLEKEEKDKKDNDIKNTLEEIDSIDYFLIDTNCLIHPMCFKILAENNDNVQDKLEGKMINKVIEYIEELIDFVKPKKGVYIAIDGVAPVAKIKQQRSRRFKSVHDKELWDKIKNKHNKPLSNNWNNSAITPGTQFMEKLHNKIMSWSKEQKLQIIYSSCNTPSEGEHKLLQFIRSNQKENLSYKYVLYGLDADLIFLALSANCNEIYLLREANQMNKNEADGVLNYVSIRVMKECIYQTMEHYYKKTLESFSKEKEVNKMELNRDKLTQDFIFLCYFLGNDFLPHLPSLDIHKDGIEYLLESYINILSDKRDYLIDIKKSKIKINQEFLASLLSKLAEKEESILKSNFGKHKRFQKCESSDPYDIEIFKIENLQFKIDDPIKLGSDNHKDWRRRYYKHYFGCETDESIESFSKKLVKNYLVGIKWVTEYYFDKCPSWDWYFPYEHPPFLSDINMYLKENEMNKITFIEGKALKPFVQLLCVLPQQSNYLLPTKLKNLMSNPKSSLAHLYPIDFQQDYINKNKYWMGIPILPSLEIDLVKYIFTKYQDELTKEDHFKNRLCDNYVFN
jgi:5'-3' exonuclease